MRRFATYLLAAGCCLVLTAIASAQVSRTPQADQPAPGQGFTFPSPLHAQADVRQSLRLTDDQLRRLGELDTRLQGMYRNDFTRAYGTRETDRGAALNQTWGRYRTDWSRGAGEIFNENQMNRYRQLEMQFRGTEALIDADARRRLNLTEDQISRFNELNTQYQRQYRDFLAPDAARQENYRDRWARFRSDYNDRIGGILTEEQRRTWGQMTGERFDFAPPTGGRGR